MDELERWVRAAREGDLSAYGQIIRATEPMVYAVTLRVLRQRADALDATQEAFLRAYRGIHTLSTPAAFVGYLRRTAIRAAHDVRRAHRVTFVPDQGLLDSTLLDGLETRAAAAQQTRLGRALVALSSEERRVTDRFYYGAWSLMRLAEQAGVSEPAMRKRLQRIRDKLREEMEAMERNLTGSDDLPADVSDRVIELLARPTLVDLPENLVGKIADRLKELFSDYTQVQTSEIVDLASARKQFGQDPVYVPHDKLFHVDPTRILRYDLSLPLALGAAGRGSPLRLLTAGKVYRDEIETATHLAAFHQLELLSLDEAERNAPWAFVGRVLSALDALLPGLPARVERTEYPFCTRAWDIGVEVDGTYVEVLGCGVYRPEVVRLLGGEPERHVALGLGLGLERLAALHYRVADIRKLS